MRLTLSVSGPRAGLLGTAAIRVFGREGGTIGRSPEADWALPDPNRYLSQFHARILWLHDAFWLEDTSSNGTFVNGAASALGRGARHRLAEGDSLALGDYAIMASVASAALTSPFEPAAGSAEAAIDFADTSRSSACACQLCCACTICRRDGVGGGVGRAPRFARRGAVSDPAGPIPTPLSPGYYPCEPARRHHASAALVHLARTTASTVACAQPAADSRCRKARATRRVATGTAPGG